MVKLVRSRLADISTRIDAALARSGRSGESVTIMAVTKTHPIDAVRAALECGITVIGENRVQEADAKIGELPSEYELHLVGHLQRNKAKAAAGLFHCVQSIDKPETVEALARRAAEVERRVGVFVEYNTSGETAKSGVTSDRDLSGVVDAVLASPELVFRGLMTVGPLAGSEDEVRAAFRLLRDLARRLETDYSEVGRLELSMGMSGDFESAIEEGATMVRLGTALFGVREER